MLVELINQPSKGIEECPEGPGSSGYDFSTDWPHQGTCIGKMQTNQPQALLQFSLGSLKRKAISFFFSRIVHPPLMHQDPVCSLRDSHLCWQAVPRPSHPITLGACSRPWASVQALKHMHQGLWGPEMLSTAARVAWMSVCHIFASPCPPRVCQSVCLSVSRSEAAYCQQQPQHPWPFPPRYYRGR